MIFLDKLKYQRKFLVGIALEKRSPGFCYFKRHLLLLACLWIGVFCLCSLGYPVEAQEFPQWQAEQNNLPGGAVRIVNLSSGVKAFIQRVPNSEATGVCLSVKAGSKLDTKGSWGRAHFLEHLLFRRTAAFSGGKLTVSLENVGADRGANTTESCINFWEVVPQNALDLTLQIEADRLSGVVFTQNELEMERKLLLGELSKLRANPWRLVQQHLLSNLYPHLSEGELVPDGDAEDIKSITAKELVDFYKHSFVPNRACVYLITSEPFNLAAARLERHFGKNLLKKRKVWEEQSEAVYQKQKETPRNYAGKAASSKELLSFAKVKACTDKSGQGLAVLAWPAPQLNSADYAHWLVLNILWADSSEAYLQKVLRDHGLASKVTLNYDIDFGDSLYVVGAHCTPEVDPQEVARLLEEAVTAPVDDNFIASRLEAAKGRATAHFYQLWQNYRDRLSLYQSLSLGKENGTIASIPEAISQVRAENINSLWRRLALKEPKKFISDRADFWSNLEASPGPRTVFAKPENSDSDSKDKSFSDKTRQNDTGSATQYFKSANGISWQVWTDNSLPIVVMRGFLSFPQDGHSEVYRAAAGMLGHHFIKEGHNSTPFAEVVEQEGISLSFQQRYNGVAINGWCLRAQLPRFLELLNSVFANPEFEELEIDRALARYKRSNTNFEVNDWNRALNIFTTQICRASSKENEQSNSHKLDKAELWQSWHLLTKPANLSLSFSGCVQVEDLQRICKFGIFAQQLDNLEIKNTGKYGVATASPATKTQKIFTEGRQSSLLILAGQAGPGANHPDYLAYNVILQILGGNSSARLPLRIVHLEKLGSSAVTYDLTSGGGCSAWLAAIRTKEGGQERTLAILRQELQRLASSSLSQAELKRAVSACKGKLQVAWSNPAGKAEWLRWYEGRPESVFTPEDYLAAYDKVSLHDIRRVAKVWFNEHALTIVCSQKKSSTGEAHQSAPKK